jgi:hypothetical protein
MKFVITVENKGVSEKTTVDTLAMAFVIYREKINKNPNELVTLSNNGELNV